MRRLALVPLLALVLSMASATAAPAAQQAQCFDETGYCIDQSVFQSYFANRGGARILGFPVSRTFRLEGFSVQFFQRVVLQDQGGNVARLNLLDPGILPVTRANQSVFPAPDPGLAADAPRPDDPAYASRVVDYLGSVSPDSWNGLPVGFSTLFNTTVPAEGVSPEIRTLLNLEIWGLPTSAPAVDPGNSGFVYQRFQRGIMHFRTDCNCTDGILVGDYLKTVLTGRDLPPDLAAEMQSSRFFEQYAPGAPGWLARPADLADTDLTGAFEPGQGAVASVATATPTPLPAQPTPTPVPDAPTPTPVPSALLTGLVKPAQTGIRVVFLDIPLETSTGGDGAYSLPGIPLGEHFLYAQDPRGQVSDTYRVSLNGGQTALNMDMQVFKPGNPGLFVGHVVNASGAPVAGATVWRIGAAGVTESEAQGLFRLVDTFADPANPLPPAKVTFVAASSDRWGLATVDFGAGTTRDRLEVKLSRQGSVPTPPRRVGDFKTAAFDANAADFFTARFPSNGTDLISVDVVDKDGKALPDGAFSARGTQCLGECNGFGGSALSIKLPRDVAFKLVVRAKNGGDATKPGWDEAQLVAYR